MATGLELLQHISIDNLALVKADLGTNPELANYEDFTSTGAYPLMYAAYYGVQEGIVHSLTSCGAILTTAVDANWVDKANVFPGTIWNALWVGVYREKSTTIASLITHGYSANAVDTESKVSENILMFACRSVKAISVAALLSAGATVSNKDDNGKNSLHYAMEANDNTIINSLLGTTSPPVNIGDSSDKMPLMIGAEKDNVTELTALISKGALVDAKDVMKKIALMYAAEKGSINAVTYLVGAGASIDLKDSSGSTALMYAASMSSKGYDNIVSYLVGTAKADVTLSDGKQQTVLMWAGKKGYATTIDTILASGSIGALTEYKELQDIKGWTALKWATEYGQSTTITNKLGSVYAEIRIKQDATDIFNGTGLYNFGDITIGTTSPTITFTISNPGTASLTLGSAVINAASPNPPKISGVCSGIYKTAKLFTVVGSSAATKKEYLKKSTLRGTGSITMTGTGTTRTATVTSTGTPPFVSTDFNTNVDLCGYLITSTGGRYQIVGYTSASVITIKTVVDYVNESHTSYTVEHGSAWTEYTAPVALDTNETTYKVQARQTISGKLSNASEPINVYINTAATVPPTIVGIASSTYTTNQAFTITKSSSGAFAQYTINGGANWFDYRGQVEISLNGIYEISAKEQATSTGGWSSNSVSILLILNKPVFITTTPASPVVVNGSTTFTISCTPIDEGTAIGSFTITTNDPYNSTYTFTLSVTGI